ncbi:ribulose-1,5-biphosphate synthetase [candidate division TA06 bacterium DG_26]|uniref:Thiamine thiazole synthase n=1 Tax=candidate division TA06 bacterium DG_26 TaxID=1703771 RepID=A0A0S7WMJ7_UNCT6|nr:MAG: ribulose-1,5-biphosphate synthetase [candidate division TA06 bacterium DG_26]
MLDEIMITRAIVEEYSREFLDSLDCDVAIAGAGPSGLCAAYYIGKHGHKVLIFERNLKVGGGMAGGGMMFNRIVLQEESRAILDELGVTLKEYAAGYYVAHSLEALAMLTVKAMHVGVRIFNGISVEDTIIKHDRVEGVVVNWSAVDVASLHVDPLSVRSKVTIDATGHSAEVVKVVERRLGRKLLTQTGGIVGEGAMWAEMGERRVVENTTEVFPNLYVCGMAANAVFGAPRMGPVFGGMFLSGRKVAELALEKIG